MSEALISSLNTRIQQLEADKASLNAALTSERKSLKALKAETAKHAETLKALETDRDGWKAKATAAPTEKDAEVARLKGDLAQRDHRDTFRADAAKLGVNPARLDSLYKLLDLKPGDAPPKAGEFAEALAAAKEAHPWAFDGDTTASGGTTGASGATGANGSQAHVAGGNAPNVGGRGGPGASSGQVSYTLGDTRAPGWMRARPELVEALAKGTAVLIGE